MKQSYGARLSAALGMLAALRNDVRDKLPGSEPGANAGAGGIRSKAQWQSKRTKPSKPKRKAKKHTRAGRKHKR